MADGHAIETLSFEVEFATETQARAQHMRFGDFAAGRALEVIEEVFDEFVAAGETVRLDQLEVDLGETPPDWSEAEAEQRLREALRRALREAIGPRPPAGDAPRPADGIEAADLETVWRQLHHGLLPWNLATADRAAFEALVLRVVARHAATLAARLHAAPARGRLVARAARQWPRAALAALAAELGLGAAAVATLPPPDDAPDAWEAALRRQVGAAPAHDPDAVAADAAPGPRIPLDDAAWPRLINGEPAAVRARLRALARRPADRARLAALLTDARQRQVLGLWAPAGDVDILQALFAAPRAWRLGGGRLEAEALTLALREALLAHVLPLRGDTFDLPAAIEALVVARAAVDGLAPAAVAQALVAGWPVSGPGADAGAPLRAAVAARLPGVALPPTAGPGTPAAEAARPAGFRFDVAPGEPPTDDGAAEAQWTRRVRLAPAGLADQLRRLGRTAAARRRLARDLTPARLAEVLALWAAPADAALIAAAVAAPDPWRLAGPHAAATLATLLRQWLLDDLLLAPPGPPRDAADLLAALIRRRAAYDDRPAADIARALAAAWPTDGPASEIGDRLRELLADVAAPWAAGAQVSARGATRSTDGEAVEGETVETPSSAAARPVEGAEDIAARADAEGGDAEADAEARSRLVARIIARRGALRRALDRRDVAAVVAPIRTALGDDRPWLAAHLRERLAEPGLGEALAAGLPPALLFELAELGLSESALRIVLAVLPLVADEGAEAWRASWTAVLQAAWSPAPSRVATPAAQAMLATGALTASAAALVRRLAGVPAIRGRLRQALRAAGVYVRDEIAASPEGVQAPTSAPVSLAAWRGRLPERPSAAAVRAISALLTPPAAGVRALADFPEAERRELIRRLRPADAPGALAAADMLAAAAAAADLAAPPEGWAAFGWRAVLRELFEEARGFETAGFAARWFEAWAATHPPPAAQTARGRLVLALETLPLARALGPSPTDHEAAAIPAAEARGPRTGLSADPTPGDRTADPVPSASPAPGPQAPTQADQSSHIEGPAADRIDRGRMVRDETPLWSKDRAEPTPDGPDAHGPDAHGERPATAEGKAHTPDAAQPGEPAADDASPADASAARPGDRASPADLDASAERPPGADSATPVTGPGETLPVAEPTPVHAEAPRPDPPAVAPPEAPQPADEPQLRADTTDGPVAKDAAPTSRDLADGHAPADGPATALPDPAALAAALRPPEPAGAAATDAADEPEPDGTIYVDNAGLVLTGPFIPMLLNRLELTRGGRFVDDRSRERAVHILQFLVSGEDEPAPEHRLALVKLVCGLDFPIPVGRTFRIEDNERAVVESLLRTIIERWTTLGRTSIGGLRETFLMRRGALRPHIEESWRLTVEPGPFDMLLDRIPWGYGLLKLPWMAQVLHVDWR